VRLGLALRLVGGAQGDGGPLSSSASFFARRSRDAARPSRVCLLITQSLAWERGAIGVPAVMAVETMDVANDFGDLFVAGQSAAAGSIMLEVAAFLLALDILAGIFELRFFSVPPALRGPLSGLFRLISAIRDRGRLVVASHAFP